MTEIRIFHTAGMDSRWWGKMRQPGGGKLVGVSRLEIRELRFKTGAIEGKAESPMSLSFAKVFVYQEKGSESNLRRAVSTQQMFTQWVRLIHIDASPRKKCLESMNKCLLEA